MSINRDTVKHVALLSRIELDDKELDIFTRQLGSILAYVDQLKEVETKGTAPMEHIPSDGRNVLRDDVVKQSLTPSQALEQAPDKAGNHFRVPKVVE